MNLQPKQYNFLKHLLKDYNLKKDINLLTSFEASLIIEGILNKGIVSKVFMGRNLTDKEFQHRQEAFNTLVDKKPDLATEKQIVFLKQLSMSTNLKLINEEIYRIDVNPLIQYFKFGTETPILDKYFKQNIIKENKELIRVKNTVNHEKSNLPKEWIMQDIQINGFIDFKKKS